MSPRLALRCLRWSYCAFIVAASWKTMQAALEGHGEGPHGPRHLLVLAAVEIIAALALLVEPIELFACAVLLLVYLVASVLSVIGGDWFAILRFIYFGVTAAYIVFTSRKTLA
jgi:hypothetical protein